MKTIKMVADELGVTKQTIVNNAKSLNISFEKENGINYIDDNDCLKIIEKITKKESNIKNKESVNKKLFDKNTVEVEKYAYNNSNSSETLKIKLNELEKQIEIFETRAKNDEKYIENLTKQLDQQNSNVNTLNKLLENQQILALESNKKIQKLESQLEERQLNYSFDTVTNDRLNINPQEATFTKKSQNINQQKKKSRPTEIEINHKDVSQKKKNDSTNEDEFTKEDEFVEETKSDSNDNREVEPPKKGFWSRFFGN
ncbi:putative coiled-coil protein SlyX [Staphylococcus hominis]